MGIAKVTRNYQVTIPQDVRRIHSISVGDTVLFAIEGDRVDFFKMKRETILKEAAGCWKKMKESGVEFVRNVRGEWKKRKAV